MASVPADPLKRRRAGVLLHPTSLPSGKLDDDALRWLDFLAGSGLSVWQMLPLTIPDQTHSPYQSPSAFAANPGLLDNPALATPIDDQDAYRHYCAQQRHWLEDFALFESLKAQFDQQPWTHWPAAYRDREPGALEKARQSHKHQIDAIRRQQFRLHERWLQIREYAAERDIHLFGDMPIFIAHDSADVWTHRPYFLLDERGEPTVVAGVPPDYFSETGQRWGNPQYNWQAMQADGFSWWMARMRHHLDWFDIVRIDHFRGLEAVWTIPASCETAVDGYWEKVPGATLLETLREQMGELPIVAEDLGVITPEVVELRKRFKLPGMAVLQFAFDAFEDNPHKPKNIQPDTVVYTGTHDNDTTLGWFRGLKPDEQSWVLEQLGASPEQAPDIAWLLIETAFSCAANLAIVPLQDYLGLGSEARMNLPGHANGNWQWRFDWDQIADDLGIEIHRRVESARRLPDPTPRRKT